MGPSRYEYCIRSKDEQGAAALMYFHGGSYVVESVDGFENDPKLLAEEPCAQV